MPVNPIGIGVVGCGDIARVRYFPAIEALPEFALKAIHSRTADACADLAMRYGVPVYPGLGEFLHDPAVEAVVIATPHPTHAELSIAALNAGRHVLTEKPMATSADAAARVREAAETSGRIFMALPFDRYPAVDAAKTLIAAGAIGRVASADTELAHQGPAHAPWFFDAPAAGWGVLADLGVYLISQLTYLFGPAECVAGRVGTLLPERISAKGARLAVSVDDNVAAVIGWADGLVATVRTNWCSPSDHRNVICQTRIYGTAGIVFINLASATEPLVVYAPGRLVPGGEEIAFNGLTGCWRVPLPAWNHDHQIMRAFAAAIASATPMPADGASASHQQHVVEIIAALYEASATGATRMLKQHWR